MMKPEFEHIDELIAKVLAGEASTEELSALQNWRSQSAGNEQYYSESEKIFTAIENIKITHPVNAETAWNKLNQKLTEGPAKIIPLHRRPVILRAAAGLALLIVLAVVTKRLSTLDATPPLIVRSAQKPEQTILPDGSKVFMNKNTELSYATNTEGERTVKLKGEAYFEVVHNEEKPFIINVNEVMIKDIGTSFNVKALPDNATVEVVVESGEVQFYSVSNLGLRLVKGEKAVYEKSTRRFLKLLPSPTENTLSYKSKQFEFKSTLLKEVVKQLNEVYPVHIRLQDKSLDSLHLSAMFNNETPEYIVEIIADTFGLEVEKKEGSITLKQKKQP